jgi:hypothetical protein
MAKKAKTVKQSKPAKKVVKQQTVSVSQFNKMDRRIARLEKENQKLKAAKVPAGKAKAKRKPSAYNKFVQKGLKAGKDMSTIAKEWKEQNGGE